MIIKYVNSKGTEINLNYGPYKMLVSDLLDYEWETVEASEQITGFQKNISEKTINIDIIKNTEKSARILMNDLTNIFETDIVNFEQGKIYVDDYYLPCFIFSSEKSNWETDFLISCEYGIVTDYPYWIKEETYSFEKGNAIDTDIETVSIFLDYPYGYLYDYTFDGAKKYLMNNHYTSCGFKMIIYGPCLNPSITIGGNKYEIITSILEGEYLEILSAFHKRTIKKVGINGEITNEFANRNGNPFQLIPSGSNIVSWDGEFGFDITLYQERSEPKWNL